MPAPRQEPVAQFPAYTYVPGVVPHPISDAAGHMYGSSSLPEHWTQEQVFQWGIRLFDHGFYWEAHETWEHLWLELGRVGSDAYIVKGLIKLAACGVKCLEQNKNGAVRHASRAVELLSSDSSSPVFAGITLDNARKIASRAAVEPPLLPTVSDGTPTVLTGWQLS